jgi:hypothetical protein
MEGNGMSEYLKAPTFLDAAYTNVGGGWMRKFPWTKSSKRDSFETVYVRRDQAVRVYVHKDFIRDCTAAVFDINQQIRHAGVLQRRRQNQKGRTRPGRLSKRQREAQRI